MTESLLNVSTEFDDIDKELFAVQLRNLQTIKDREGEVSSSARWLRRVAQYLFPVGADEFEKSMVKLRNRVRGNAQIHGKWSEACHSYNNPTYKDVLQKLDWLPWTMNDVYVFDIVARITSTMNGPKTMVHFLSDHVVGPGVQAAFMANLCLWCFYMIYPFVAYLTSFVGCWTPEANTFAHYDIFVLALYFPVLLVVMYFEYRTLIYALPPQVAIIGPFAQSVLQFLPKCANSFVVWFLCASTLSVLAHLDLATNSLFLSKVLATPPQDMERIENAWQKVFSQSVFGILAHHAPSFAVLVKMLWFFIFGQCFYGVICSVPIAKRVGERAGLSGVKALLNWKGHEEFYEVKDRDQGGKAFGFVTYPTILHQRTQHGGALQALSESGRMYTVRFNSWHLQQQLVNLNLYKSGQLYRDLVRTASYFFVFMWFESIVQLELQGSALELGKAMSPTHKVDKEMILSVLLSVFMACYNHYIVCTRFYKQTWTCLGADVDDNSVEAQAHNNRVKIYCYIWMPVFIILALSFTWLLVHVLMKTVMVSFFCDCGWNVRLNPLDGCVRPFHTTGENVTCFDGL